MNMVPLHPRQSDILQFARSTGRVEVDGLASQFDVTPQTIRKDLNDLCDAQLLQRVHGGAVYPSSTSNMTYQSRREIAHEGKTAIARHAATLIPNDSSLILNVGTTTERVAEALRDHIGLMVVTNNLNVASILAASTEFDVVIAGGMIRKSDLAIVGEAAIDLIEQFKVDYAIIGTSSIDEEGSILDFDYREVRVSQAILKQARKRILVADSTKFERRAPVQIGTLKDVDVFITDEMPSEQIVSLCEASSVELVVTENEETKSAEAALSIA